MKRGTTTPFVSCHCLALALAAWVMLPEARGAAGRDPEYLVRNWTTADGLPDNTVRAIVETGDGYLWMATANGLARFDGIRFTSFTTANTPGLPSANGFALAKDPQNGLWMHTGRGLLRYHDGRFTGMPRPEDNLPGGVTVFNDAWGELWVRHGDDVLRWKGDRFEPHLSKPDGPASVPGIHAGTNGTFWYVARNGLWHVRGDKAELAMPGFATDLIAQGRDGRLWAIPGGTNLGRLEAGRWNKVTDLPVRCRTLWVASNNDVWLGADTTGRAFRWRDGTLLEIGPEQGLQGNRTIQFAEDREGNIWLGMNGGGLFRLREKRLRVFDMQHGFGNTAMASVIEDAHGGIFASCMGQGAYQLVEDRFEPLLPGMPNSGHRLATALAPAAAGGAWVGMFHGALPRVANQRIVQHIGSDAGTRSLLVDRAGDLWRGTRSGGVEHFSGSRVTRYAVSNGLSFNNVYALAQDRGGAVWAGTESGLNRIHEGRVTQFGRSHGLGHHFVTALCVDSRGTLWAGTLGGGLSGWNGRGFVTLTMAEGLVDDMVQQLVEDDLGHLWIGTRAGLMRVAVALLHDYLEGKAPTIHGTLVGRGEGLVRPTCWTEYQPAGIKARDGRLWICTGSGLALIDPRRFATPRPPPVAHIEEVRLGSGPAAEVRGTAAIEVPARTERLQIHYTGISPSDPELVQFRYRLAGYDRDWIEAGRVRFAAYSHVAPARYRFEVQAVNNHGVWSEPAVLDLVLRPAFWQTTWFRGALVLLLAALLYGAYRVRIARLERRRADQEAFSRQLIDSQEQERKRIAAELHDSLGQNLLVIKNRAALALQQRGEPEKMAEQVGEVSTVASIAIREVRAIAQNLRPVQIDELGLAKSIASMARNLAESSGIAIEADLDDPDGALPPESQIHLYRIVQECLNNVVKHSQARSAVIRLRREPKALQLVVADDGQGFADRPAAVREGHGFGLRNIAERARTLGGTLVVRGNPGNGTRIELTIPLRG